MRGLYTVIASARASAEDAAIVSAAADERTAAKLLELLASAQVSESYHNDAKRYRARAEAMEGPSTRRRRRRREMSDEMVTVDPKAFTKTLLEAAEYLPTMNGIKTLLRQAAHAHAIAVEYQAGLEAEIARLRTALAAVTKERDAAVVALKKAYIALATPFPAETTYDEAMQQEAKEAATAMHIIRAALVNQPADGDGAPAQPADAPAAETVGVHSAVVETLKSANYCLDAAKKNLSNDWQHDATEEIINAVQHILFILNTITKGESKS